MGMVNFSDTLFSTQSSPWVSHTWGTNIGEVQLNPEGQIQYRVRAVNHTGVDLSPGNFYTIIPIPKKGQWIVSQAQSEFFDLQREPFGWSMDLVSVNAMPAGFAVSFSTDYAVSRTGATFVSWSAVEAQPSNIRSVKITNTADMLSGEEHMVEFILNLTLGADVDLAVDSGNFNRYSAIVFRSFPAITAHRRSEPVAMQLQIGLIEGTVFRDINRDGIQNAGEPGINGVLVEVFEAGTNTLLGTTTTQAINGTAGRFQLTMVAQGETVDLVFTNPGTALDPMRFSRAYEATVWDVAASQATATALSVRAGYTHNTWVFNQVSIGLVPLLVDITFDLNGGNVAGDTENIVERVYYFEDIGNVITIPEPVRSGHRFLGWRESGVDPLLDSDDIEAMQAYKNRTFVAQWQRTGGGGNGGTTIIGSEVPLVFLEDHIWYVRGFAEGDFRPNNSITRAEMSMILFRLLDSADKYTPRSNNFSDVHAGWYAQAVSYLASRNIVQGYPDGTFRPNASITRAELTAVMSRFFEINENGTHSFNDVSGSHWAIMYINNAVNRGWVEGFPNGTFRPNNSTTRAEAVTLLNRVLGRIPNPVTIRAHLYEYLQYHHDKHRLFTDLTDAHWAYYQIMEAATEHDFTRDNGGLEVWSEVRIPWLDASPRI